MKRFSIILAALLTLAVSGCTPPQPPSTAGGQPGSAGAGAGDVFANPGGYEGKTIHVEGVFQGFRADQCRFAPSARASGLTRSDWLVSREGYCLFVTGGIPEGLDPFDPGAVGRRIDLRARVIDAGDGKVLLQMVDARPL